MLQLFNGAVYNLRYFPELEVEPKQESLKKEDEKRRYNIFLTSSDRIMLDY
jgi:hypothetical protein